MASKIEKKVPTEKLPEKSIEMTVGNPVKKPNGKTEKSDDPAEKSMGANSTSGLQSGGKTPISAEQLLPTASKEIKQDTKPTPRYLPRIISIFMDRIKKNTVLLTVIC